MVVSAPAAGQPPRAIRRSVPAHGGSASADCWAARRHAREVGSACARLQPARRASGGRSLIGTAEKAGADRPGMTAGESDGGARRRGSPAWSCLDGPQQTEPGVRLSCGWNIEVDAGLSWRRSAERATGQMLQQAACDHDAEGGDRVGIMPFGADAATRAGGSPAAAPGLIVQHGRRGLRGKNGSAR